MAPPKRRSWQDIRACVEDSMAEKFKVQYAIKAEIIIRAEDIDSDAIERGLEAIREVGAIDLLGAMHLVPSDTRRV